MTSREYWSKREREALEHYLTEEAAYAKRINEIYDYMLDNISKEINGFYTKYAKDEKISMADAKKKASTLDMKSYSRKAKRYVKNKDFSSNANAEMKLYNLTMKVNRLELLKANIGLEMVDGFDDLEKYFDEILNARTLAEFERQAGILGQSIGDNAKAANAIVNASFSNAKFSDRIWMYQGMLKDELSSLLATGLIQGRHPNELSRHLQKRFGVNKVYADRLMRTELCRVQIEAQRQSYKSAGYQQYMFITTHDAKTCSICRPLDGQIFNLKDMQVGDNAPPLHPNCRCSTAAYMDRAEVEKQIAIMTDGEKELAYIHDDGKIDSGHVNLSLVNTEKYHRKYEKLTAHKATDESLYNEAMEILKARNNTEFEEIVAIDARTGARLAKNSDAVTYNIKHRCGFSKDEERGLQEGGKYFEAFHNHPNSSFPSRDDIKKLYEREYQMGSTIGCHSGTIYRLKKCKPFENIDSFIENIYSGVKEEFYYLNDAAIELKTSKRIVYLLKRGGYLNFEER